MTSHQKFHSNRQSLCWSLWVSLDKAFTYTHFPRQSADDGLPVILLTYVNKIKVEYSLQQHQQQSRSVNHNCYDAGIGEHGHMKFAVTVPPQRWAVGSLKLHKITVGDRIVKYRSNWESWKNSIEVFAAFDRLEYILINSSGFEIELKSNITFKLFSNRSLFSISFSINPSRDHMITSILQWVTCLISLQISCFAINSFFIEIELNAILFTCHMIVLRFDKKKL